MDGQKDDSLIKKMVLEVASHEFLHILTPLNIHSREISDFNFRSPVMSQHLWLYEGVTEYFANLVQVQNSLLSPDDFMNSMNQKIVNAERYANVSFTTMSKNIVETPYKSMYPNVYEKGALIGFLLDIRLNELSGGKMGLRDLMMQLAQKYGPDKPFEDDKFISEIVSMTYPEIQEFFDLHVTGEKPLPFKDYLVKIGWDYNEIYNDTVFSFGLLNFKYEKKNENFVLVNTEPDLNLFRLQTGDALLTINGSKIELSNYDKLLEKILDPKNEEETGIVYRRKGEMYQTGGKPIKVPVTFNNVIKEVKNPAPEQVALSKFLFGF